MAVIALRTPESWFHPSFYAEDGVIFFRDQLLYGWRAWFTPYNGYFHLVPRVLATFLLLLPVSLQPMLYALANAGIQSLCASFFYLPENRIIVRSDWLRLIVGALLIVDYQASEMLGTIMVAQWFLFPVALMLLWQSMSKEVLLSRARAIIYAIFLIIICLSTPLLLVATPLAVWGAFRSRGYSRLIPAGFCLAIAVQAIAFARQAPTAPVAHPASLSLGYKLALNVVATIGAWVYRVLLTCTVGEGAAKKIALIGGQWLAVTILVLAIIALARIWRTRFKDRRLLFLGCLGVSILLVYFSIVIRGLIVFFPDLQHYVFFEGGARYFIVSEWLLFVSIAILIEQTMRGWTSARQGFILVSVFIAGAITNFLVEDQPDQHWEQYSQAVTTWKRQHDRHLPTNPLIVPINPPPYTLDLP